jgi:hypothetical protein
MSRTKEQIHEYPNPCPLCKAAVGFPCQGQGRGQSHLNDMKTPHWQRMPEREAALYKVRWLDAYNENRRLREELAQTKELLTTVLKSIGSKK